MNELTNVQTLSDELMAQAAPVLNPEKYSAAVFDGHRKQLAKAKREASKVEAYDITTTAGMSVAKDLRASFRDIRTSAENTRKDRKAPIIQIGKLIDAKYKELEAEIEPLESKYDAEIKGEEKRKADEKARKESLERARVEAIEGRLAQIRGVPGRMASADSQAIRKEIDQWTLLRLDPDDYQEYLEDALRAVTATLDQLGDLLTAAEGREAEARRIAAEREELARLQAEAKLREQAEREAAAERERLAKIERDKAEVERRAAAERQELADKRMAEMEAERIKNQELMLEVQAITKRGEVDGDARTLLQALVDAETLVVDVSTFGLMVGMAQMAKEMAVSTIGHKYGVRLAAELQQAWDDAYAEKAQRETVDVPMIEEGAPIAWGVDIGHPDGDHNADWMFGMPTLAELPFEHVEAAPVRPTDGEIIEVLATHYEVSEDTITAWLKGMEL